MKKIHLAAALSAALGISISFSASASPVHATFTGSVTGSTGFFTQVLADFPTGTAASFDITFDDASLTPTYPSSFGIGSVSGTVDLGAYEWTLDSGNLSSFSYFNTPPYEVVWYQLQLTGTGPMISSAGSLFGLFLQLTPDLNPFSPTSFMVGFGYPVESGTFYSYANISGQYAVDKSTAAPEPEAAFMLLPSLALLWRVRRSAKRRATASRNE